MSTQTNESVGQAYLAEARRRLADCHEKIRHCLGQMDDPRVWWRPREPMNSVGNLVLHLCGNLRQWVVSGVGGAADVRDRPAEFAERGAIGRDELLRRLAGVVGEVDDVLSRVSDRQLLEPRRVQGFDETVLSAVFASLSHLAGHTQEIVYVTRLQQGDAYQFAWVPPAPEQSALAAGPPSEEVVKATDAVFERGPVLEATTDAREPRVEVPSAPGGGSGRTEPEPSRPSPLGDYVRELGQEFQEEQDEGKL